MRRHGSVRRSRAGGLALLTTLIAFGAAGAPPAATQELRVFYCFAPVAATRVIYVSPVHAVGPVVERARYGEEFAAHLATQGVRPASEGPAFCNMRASESQIVRERDGLVWYCPLENGARSPLCGQTWTVRDVAWARSPSAAASGPVAAARTQPPPAAAPRPQQAGTPSASLPPSSAAVGEIPCEPAPGRARVRPHQPGVVPNRPTPADLHAQAEREARGGDACEAAHLFLRAANAGVPEAQVRMGDFYFTGTGIGLKQDLAESFRWYRLAAEQGSVYAQLMLGRMYRDGKGVPANRNEAIRWLQRAANGGDGRAAAELRLLLPAAAGPVAPQSPASGTSGTPAPGTPPVRSTTRYGSLSIDRNNGNAFGWAVDYPTQSGADTRAINECRARSSSCYVVLRFTGCGAYVTDRSSPTLYGWGTAATREAAQARAFQEARARGGRDLLVRVWGCNSRP
jgi:hypothetical protein